MLEIKFDLSQFQSVEICPIADVHIGNPLCNETEFKRLVDYVMEEPDDPNTARVCLLNGDLTESVTRTSKVGNVFDQTMTPSVQVATMLKYLKPLTEPTEKYPQGKIISYCAGNHDDKRYKDTGISAAESIAVGLGLEDRFSTDGCYTFLVLGRIQTTASTTVTIYNTHMTGGSSTVGGKANRVAKISNGVIADIIVGSHVHTPMSFKEDVIIPFGNKLVQKTITYIVTGAFLRYGDYAQQSSYKPATIVTPRILVYQGRTQTHKKDTRYTVTEVIL